jgi:hypothetical protein
MNRKKDRGDNDQKPSLLSRVTRGLSFMNKLALAILVLGCLAVAFKHS